MPVIVKDPTLPPGWEALYDEGQQVTYYWQRASGTVTYEKPAAVAAPVWLKIRLLLIWRIAPTKAHDTVEVWGP